MVSPDSPVVTNCKGTPRELWPIYNDRGTAETIRSRLIKIGARVRRTVRRVWVHLAEGFPLRDVLVRAHRAILQWHPPPLPS